MSKNLSLFFFSNKSCDRPPSSSKDLNTGLGLVTESWWDSPGEFLAPPLLLRIEVSFTDGEIIHQLRQPRNELVDFLLNIFVLLGDCKPQVAAVWDEITP